MPITPVDATPIDTGRHGTIEMRRIFEEEARVQKLLDVEAALAWAHAEVGDVPQKDAAPIGSLPSLPARHDLLTYHIEYD